MFSISIASDASVRTVLVNAIYTAAQKENKEILGENFWSALRVLLVAHASIDWKFDRTPWGGDNDKADLYWDDIDDPLAAFLAAHDLEINQKKLGLFFKKLVTESELCQACSVLFTVLEVLPGCGHMFCEPCILKHNTSPCLCENCFVNRNDSPCEHKKAHLACPKCSVFIGSDFIYVLKQKPDYGKFMFKDIGRRHRVAVAMRLEKYA